MRIGKDLLVLTKKEGLLTCMLISRSFLEDNNLKKVIVPTPSFLDDGTAYYETVDEMEKHTLETSVIYKYSPFASQQELLVQFRRIRGENGTLVICYNLRRIEGGKFEMDFETDPFDVRLTGHIPHREEERNSLRAYLAVLYANPRMRVFLRGEKVDTKRVLSTLYKPRMYKYQARNLKACAEKELQDCQKKVVELNDTVARYKSEVADFEVKHPGFMSDATLRIHYRSLVKAVDVASEMLSASEQRLKKLARAKSNPSPLIFYFGLNIQHRNRYGCMVYNNGRLIRMYEKVNNQKEKNDRMLKYLGVVALVDVPCSVLAPAHSKQSFENPREFANLLKAINDYMEQYWNDTAIDATPGGVANFCMNPNSLFRSCSKLEELPKIPEGRLMKLMDKPPIVASKKEKEPNPAPSQIKTQKAPTARKRLPTPPPPRSSQRKIRAQHARTRSPSPDSDSSDEHEPLARKSSSAKKSLRRSKTVAVRMRKANDARSSVKTVTATSKRMLTSTRRSSVGASRHGTGRSRAQLFDFHNSDEDDLSEEEPTPKRRLLAKTKASMSNGIAKKQTASVKDARESVESIERLSSEEKTIQLSRHKSEEKVPKVRENETVVMKWSDKEVEAVPSSTSSDSQREVQDANVSTVEEVDMNKMKTREANTTVEEAHEVVDADSKRDGLVHKLTEVLEFFRESSFPKIQFANADEALAFDLPTYFAAYHRGLERLIDQQVAQKVQRYLESAVKVMKWADPEVADEINGENVLEKMDEFTKLI
ncbi:MORC family CW-type zinc finger protein 2 [Toxocara canis]|uniref:MORC family CW-type zinc finger protein 2 n=1 Tax=Toxocara canis TaxID=6265 RepID=A0A0B2UXB5_TOXCA|nr:MORC family CW-type zinc finger protein 2 [Toxocara canis]